MLNNTKKWSSAIIQGCFIGIGVGTSTVVGVARMNGVNNVDINVIPLGLAYVLFWGGFITFIIVGLWFLYNIVRLIYQLVKRFMPSTT